MVAVAHLDMLREYEAGLSIVQRLDRRRHEVARFMTSEFPLLSA